MPEKLNLILKVLGIAWSLLVVIVASAFYFGGEWSTWEKVKKQHDADNQDGFEVQIEGLKRRVQDLEGQDGNRNSQFPPGTILALWRNHDIPDGWAVCGENGTLDLQDKFLIGTRNVGAIGTPVGNESHKHSVNIETGYQVNGREGHPPEGADNWAKKGKNWIHKHMTMGETAVGKHIPPSVKVLFLCKTK